jgi:hypothetical protein
VERFVLNVSNARPNGDLLLDFLGAAAWHALLAVHGEDFERLRTVLGTAMMTWNLSVLRARGRMPDDGATQDFLDSHRQFVEVYSARKEALFPDDERLFLDVMIQIGEDGGPEVNALATFPDFDRPAASAPRAQRTRTERNRTKRARQRR